MATLATTIAPAAAPAEFHPRAAGWIWCRDAAPGPFQLARFEKRIRVARGTLAVAYVAADTFYRLRVNGRLAMHGPARQSAGRATLDAVDITRFLHPGLNTLQADVLAIDSAHIGPHYFESLAQAPGFLCEIRAGRVTWGTDASWRARALLTWDREAPRFSKQRGWVEQIDARVPDGPWRAAAPVDPSHAPWTTLEVRDIPLPVFRDIPIDRVTAIDRAGEGAAPDWVGRLANEALTADPAAAHVEHGEAVLEPGASVSYGLQEAAVGFLGFEVSGPEGGTLELAWNERAAPDGSVRPIGTLACSQAIRYTLRAGRQRYLAFSPQLVQCVRAVNRGPGSIRLHRVWLTAHSLPERFHAEFESSDPELNRVFEAARLTSRLSTLDTFMDCPSRERGAWYHDSYWSAQALYALTGDASVNRRMVRQGAESQGHLDPPGMVQMCYPGNHERDSYIPAHALTWILQAGLDRSFSGDGGFERSMLPAVERLLATFAAWRNPEGLLENVPSWNFLDWADIASGSVSTGLNAIYAKALTEAAAIERRAGRKDAASRYGREAAGVRAALNRLAPDGFYPDAFRRGPSGALEPVPGACETTQYYAMWADAPEAHRRNRMWAAMRDAFVPTPGRKVQPIQGLTRAGLFGTLPRLALALEAGDSAAFQRDAKAMFLPMAVEAPGTFWESPWGESSHCHGFGAAVAAMLMEDTLGVSPGLPIRIAPHGAGLASCRGRAMTPRGPVAVRWTAAPERYEIAVTLPAGARGEVALPPEAQAVFFMAKPAARWRGVWPVEGSARIVVTPGNERGG